MLKKILGIKYALDSERLKAFPNEFGPVAINEYLKALEVIYKGGPMGVTIGELELSDRFRWLTATKSTTLQYSKTHPGLCADPEKELEGLFNRYVL